MILLFTGAGAAASRALLPSGGRYLLERAAWSVAGGFALVSLVTPAALLTGPRWAWIAAVVFAAVASLLGWRFVLPGGGSAGAQPAWRGAGLLWLLPLAAGVAIYALRALSEPMWSNDFLACWGLKGKMIFFQGRVSERLLSDPSLAFSHPEYPLGVPFFYAGIAFLLRLWDDHAMALVFPVLQIATLLALTGWLRRRGASTAVCLGAAAALALFDPLYAAYITGYADIPLSLFALLLASAASDAVDRTDGGALRRVALAAALCAATKNEGLFLVFASTVIGFVALRRRRLPVVPLVAAQVVPAAAVVVAQRSVWGSPPLAMFDFGLLGPSEWGTLAGRAARTARLTLEVILSPGTPWLLLVLLVLFLVGRRTLWADRPLVLALCAEVMYVTLPVFAVVAGMPGVGPEFMVPTALGRTTATLAPLVAAALAGRLSAAEGPTEPVPTAAAGTA